MQIPAIKYLLTYLHKKSFREVSVLVDFAEFKNALEERSQGWASLKHCPFELPDNTESAINSNYSLVTLGQPLDSYKILPLIEMKYVPVMVFGGSIFKLEELDPTLAKED